MADKPSTSAAAQEWSDLRFQIFEGLRDHGSSHMPKCSIETIVVVAMFSSFYLSPRPKPGLRGVAAAAIDNHLMTLSAHISTFGGIVKPRVLAVLRLITISNFIGCSTGRSAGLAPFRILST